MNLLALEFLSVSLDDSFNKRETLVCRGFVGKYSIVFLSLYSSFQNFQRCVFLE